MRTRIAFSKATSQWGVVLGLLCFIWCTTAFALSQDTKLSEFRHTAWGAKEGVPSGIVTCIAQTSDGYLWLGSERGLSRFDGLHIVPFPFVLDERLSSKSIFTLFAPPSGGLWVGFTFGGVAFLKEGRVTFYTQNEGLPRGSVKTIVQQPDGLIWAATAEGLARLEGARWQLIEAEMKYPVTDTWSLLVDSGGALWVGAIGKLYFLPKGEAVFRQKDTHLVGRLELTESPSGAVWAADDIGVHKIYQNKNLKGRVKSAQREILFDRDGSLWATRFPGGIRRLAHPDAVSTQTVVRPKLMSDSISEIEGLTSNDVTGILEDREGNVWIATNKGIDRFSEPKLHGVDLRAQSRLNKFKIAHTGLAANDTGALWLANGAGLLLRRRDGGLERHDKAEDIFCAMRAKDGSNWFGSTTGLWQYAAGKFNSVPLPRGTDKEDVQAMADDAEGGLWISVVRRGVFRLAKGVWSPYGNLPVLPKFPSLSLASDKNGRVWFGYVKDQVAMVDGNDVRLYSKPQGVDVGNVTAIYGLRSRLWIGGEQGLALLDGERFRQVLPEVAQGLGSITGIVETANGDLWLNGSEGITHITAGELARFAAGPAYRVRIEVLNELDGLKGNGSRLRPLPTAIEGTDGLLWFITNLGLYWIDPARMARNPVPPPVLIKSLSVNGRPYELAASLKLPQRTTTVGIDYVALSLTMTEKVRYRYRLDGIDKDWRDVQTHREALYTNLDPGTYQFHVIAANNDGIWNETGATLDFVIPPAFVQTGWFIALCIVGGMAMVGLLIRFRVKQISGRLRGRLEARLAERERIARELHDTLLQSTQGLILRFQAVANSIPRSDPARETLEKALERADEVMAEGRDRVMDLRIPAHMWGDLQQAFATAGKDLAIESATVFRITADGAARALNANVREEIYAIGREALLNAFRHADAPLIEIEIVYAKQEFRLYVRDNGAGIEETILETGGRSGHWGLKGMRERAVAIGAKLNVLRRPEGGTQIEVSLPGGIAYKKRTMSSSMRSIRKFFGSTK
jgi:signal transduction histidine kinase/ligand-binding sensor domain-containing protein